MNRNGNQHENLRITIRMRIRISIRMRISMTMTMRIRMSISQISTLTRLRSVSRGQLVGDDETHSPQQLQHRTFTEKHGR